MPIILLDLDPDVIQTYHVDIVGTDLRNGNHSFRYSARFEAVVTLHDQRKALVSMLSYLCDLILAQNKCEILGPSNFITVSTPTEALAIFRFQSIESIREEELIQTLGELQIPAII